MCDDAEEACTSFHDQQNRNETIQKRSIVVMTKSESKVLADESAPVEITTEDPAMKAEIEAAVGFLTDFLVKAPKKEFSQESVDLFRRSLQAVLYHHYNGHWHSANPSKGSGFRCLRINGKLDPLVQRAAEACRLPLRKVRQAFPAELTVWIDPGDVSVRFGEEGSIGVWYASRRLGDEEKVRTDDHQQLAHAAYAHQMMYNPNPRSTPPLSSTPPNHQFVGYHARVHHYQTSPHQYQRQQSSPVWNPQWQAQQQAAGTFSPHRSSPSSFGAPTGNSNGFVMALNHQQQQMQMRQIPQTPVRYQPTSSSPSSRVSPLPQANANNETMENGEEQRCKMLAERLMRENLNLMASLAPGLVSSRPQPVGVGVN